MNLTSILLCLILIVLFIHSASKAKKQRAKIKERANIEYNSEQKSPEYYQERLTESEFAYQELEETYYLHLGVLVGVIAHIYWGVWYVSLVVGASVAFLGIKFLATKPFTQGVADHDA